MTDWRANGLRALQDAEVEVQNSREPMIVVVLTIPEADLIRDRAVSIYANQTYEWLHRFLSYVTWKTSVPAARIIDSSPAMGRLQ